MQEPSTVIAPTNGSSGAHHPRDEDQSTLQAEPASKRVKFEDESGHTAPAGTTAKAATALDDVAPPADSKAPTAEKEEDDVVEYTFEPEPEDLNRPTDLYLDTVRYHVYRIALAPARTHPDVAS